MGNMKELFVVASSCFLCYLALSIYGPLMILYFVVSQVQFFCLDWPWDSMALLISYVSAGCFLIFVCWGLPLVHNHVLLSQRLNKCMLSCEKGINVN